MRRWVAVFLFCMVALYLGATGADACTDGPDDACAPICHLLCSDGCATAPVPEAPVAPPVDPLPEPRFSTEMIADLVSLSPEPEKDPPRA